ncbi:hypothetical protein [Paraburkholderia bannensis]|uniref:hypothetical protein n=1 Tax=Paraburkholderia bannensis TaxID=765414 RepID=UPI0012EB0C46|nr:hypothetical protein [Paraburkholderia bannensis]
MGSPVFVKKGVTGGCGARANRLFFRRSQAWPFWAEPSSRTIFMDKNIGCYRRYIGPISLLSAKSVASGFSALFAASQHERRWARGPHGRGFCPIFALSAQAVDAPPQRRGDLMTKGFCMTSDFQKSVVSTRQFQHEKSLRGRNGQIKPVLSGAVTQAGVGAEER